MVWDKTGDELFAKEDGAYIGLFKDADLRELAEPYTEKSLTTLTASVGDPDATDDTEKPGLLLLSYDHTSSASGTFEDIKPGTYYVAETDAEGTPIKESAEYITDLYSKNAVTVEEGKTADLAYTNRYVNWLDGNYFEGKLRIEKEVVNEKGDPEPVDDVFFAGLFVDENYSEPAVEYVENILVPIDMQESAAAYVEIPIFFTPEHETVTLYVDESFDEGDEELYDFPTIANGSPITISMDDMETPVVQIKNVKLDSSSEISETTSTPVPTSANQPTKTPSITKTITPSPDDDIEDEEEDDGEDDDEDYGWDEDDDYTDHRTSGTVTTYGTNSSGGVQYVNGSTVSGNNGSATVQTNTNGASTSTPVTARTADDTPVALYVMLLALSSMIVMIVSFKKRAKIK